MVAPDSGRLSREWWKNVHNPTLKRASVSGVNPWALYHQCRAGTVTLVRRSSPKRFISTLRVVLRLPMSTIRHLSQKKADARMFNLRLPATIHLLRGPFPDTSEPLDTRGTVNPKRTHSLSTPYFNPTPQGRYPLYST